MRVGAGWPVAWEGMGCLSGSGQAKNSPVPVGQVRKVQPHGWGQCVVFPRHRNCMEVQAIRSV